MKKAFCFLLAALMICCLTACGANSRPEIAEPAAPAAPETASPASDVPSKEENAQREGRDTLVVVFSATGTTRGVAEKIAAIADADLYEIEAAEPYSSDDLNYNDRNSRSTKEQNEKSARPEIGSEIPDLSGYKTVFLGFPIWWGQAPKILYTFVESCDLSGKTIVPFCTSGSSGIGTSAENLSKSAPDAVWLAGSRFSGSASHEAVADWIGGLGLNLEKETSLHLKIGETEVPVTWEDNPSVSALKELLPLTIPMSMYGGFEQVGSIGQSIPRNDIQFTTSYGDIVLYSGNQIVIFYGSNSWAYTRLGHVDLSQHEMTALLSRGDVRITLTAE